MISDLAIVVPAGPGDRAWEALLPQLAAAGAREIVLVVPDGDASTAELLPEGVRLVEAAVGRAQQLNAGAAATISGWLWFVHADTRLEASTIDALNRFVATDATAIGYFDLRFLRDGPRLTVLNTIGAHVRSRWLGLPFGDQGLLIPRPVFDALGHFDPCQPGGEDHALVWAARRAGVPLIAVGAPIHTSARKYAQQGWWATTRQHLRLTCVQAWRYSRMQRSR